MQKLLIIMSLSALLSGCVGIPANLRAVEDFDAQRYIDTWYEIARLENRFEKGLEKVAAEYGLRDDGGLKVVNRGYDPVKGRRKEPTGKVVCGKDRAYLWIPLPHAATAGPGRQATGGEGAGARVQDRCAGVRETTVMRQPRPGDAITFSINRVYEVITSPSGTSGPLRVAGHSRQGFGQCYGSAMKLPCGRHSMTHRSDARGVVPVSFVSCFSPAIAASRESA